MNAVWRHRIKKKKNPSPYSSFSFCYSVVTGSGSVPVGTIVDTFEDAPASVPDEALVDVADDVPDVDVVGTVEDVLASISATCVSSEDRLHYPNPNYSWKKLSHLHHLKSPYYCLQSRTQLQYQTLHFHPLAQSSELSVRPSDDDSSEPSSDDSLSSLPSPFIVFFIGFAF